MRCKCLFFVFSIFYNLAVISSFADDRFADSDKIEQITGIKGESSEKKSVFKITAPRTDVKVKVNDWTFPPFMGIASWISFKKDGNSLMAMGDLALFSDEINPVIKELRAKGIWITGLHHHLLYDHPRLYFMHVLGRGDAESLASAIKGAFDVIKKIRVTNYFPADRFQGLNIPFRSSISKEIVQGILDVDCEINKGVVKVVIGRVDNLGVEIGKEMGVNSWAAFGGSNEVAVIDGDFALFEGEIQAVIDALQEANINIVAIHNHMIYENPRLIFLHFFGKGKVRDLAEGFKSALSKLKASARTVEQK